MGHGPSPEEGGGAALSHPLLHPKIPIAPNPRHPVAKAASLQCSLVPRTQQSQPRSCSLCCKPPFQIQQLVSNLLSPLMANGVSLGCSDETLFSPSVQNLSLLFIFHPFPKCIPHHKNNIFHIFAIYLFHIFSVTALQESAFLVGAGREDEQLQPLLPLPELGLIWGRWFRRAPVTPTEFRPIRDF